MTGPPGRLWREGDFGVPRRGPLEGLTCYVTEAIATDVGEDFLLLSAHGVEGPVTYQADDVDYLEPLKGKTYADVLREIEAAVLDSEREPTDEELAALEARLHGRIRKIPHRTRPSA